MPTFTMRRNALASAKVHLARLGFDPASPDYAAELRAEYADWLAFRLRIRAMHGY